MDCGTYWNTLIFFFAKLNSYFAELQCLNFQKEWSVRCGLTVITIKDAVIDKYIVIFFPTLILNSYRPYPAKMISKNNEHHRLRSS
jgi:hypothetical protein